MMAGYTTASLIGNNSSNVNFFFFFQVQPFQPDPNCQKQDRRFVRMFKNKPGTQESPLNVRKHI